MRMVFGGHPHDRRPATRTPRATSTGPSPTRSGTVWTLAPSTHPGERRHDRLRQSYGTGVTTLADGTLVTAYPLNSDDLLPGRRGAGAVLRRRRDCCAYDMTLAQDDGVVLGRVVRPTATSRQHARQFVREIYPTLGPIMQGTGVEHERRVPRRLARPSRWRPAPAAASTSPTARATRSATPSCCGRSAPAPRRQVPGLRGRRARGDLGPAPVGTAVDRLGDRRRRRLRRAHRHHGEGVRGRAAPRRRRRSRWASTTSASRAPRARADIVFNDSAPDLAPAGLRRADPQGHARRSGTATTPRRSSSR